jgi:UDP-galactopyranose mutase
MLDGIPVILNCDFLRLRGEFVVSEKIVFTGPIDAFHDFDLGRLKYRSQAREHEYLPDVDWFQNAGQINNPLHEGGRHIRTLEWKHMLKEEIASRIAGTVITREIPGDPATVDQCEYPFPDSENRELYKKYRARATARPDYVFCGRLGEYRYLDMDQAIARAMLIAEKLLAQPR